MSLALGTELGCQLLLIPPSAQFVSESEAGRSVQHPPCFSTTEPFPEASRFFHPTLKLPPGALAAFRRQGCTVSSGARSRLQRSTVEQGFDHGWQEPVTFPVYTWIVQAQSRFGDRSGLLSLHCSDRSRVQCLMCHSGPDAFSPEPVRLNPLPVRQSLWGLGWGRLSPCNGTTARKPQCPFGTGAGYSWEHTWGALQRR